METQCLLQLEKNKKKIVKVGGVAQDSALTILSKNPKKLTIIRIHSGTNKIKTVSILKDMGSKGILTISHIMFLPLNIAMVMAFNQIWGIILTFQTLIQTINLFKIRTETPLIIASQGYLMV